MELKIMDSVRGFLANSRRVFVIAKKPSMPEFRNMATVTGIGILIVALIGYAVYLLFAFTPLG